MTVQFVFGFFDLAILCFKCESDLCIYSGDSCTCMSHLQGKAVIIQIQIFTLMLDVKSVR